MTLACFAIPVLCFREKHETQVVFALTTLYLILELVSLWAIYFRENTEHESRR
jgi:hypothetical protein